MCFKFVLKVLLQNLNHLHGHLKINVHVLNIKHNLCNSKRDRVLFATSLL